MEIYKEVKLIINELIIEKIKEKLKEGYIDVVILVILLFDKDLKEENLFYEEFYYYGKLNFLGKKKKYIFFEDINMNEFLLLEEGYCF